MAYDSVADFLAAHPDWETRMVYAGEPGTAETTLVAQTGHGTQPGVIAWVWSKTDGPWFIPVPPPPLVPELEPTVVWATPDPIWVIRSGFAPSLDGYVTLGEDPENRLYVTWLTTDGVEWVPADLFSGLQVGDTVDVCEQADHANVYAHCEVTGPVVVHPDAHFEVPVAITPFTDPPQLLHVGLKVTLYR